MPALQHQGTQAVGEDFLILHRIYRCEDANKSKPKDPSLRGGQGAQVPCILWNLLRHTCHANQMFGQLLRKQLPTCGQLRGVLQALHAGQLRTARLRLGRVRVQVDRRSAPPTRTRARCWRPHCAARPLPAPVLALLPARLRAGPAAEAPEGAALLPGCRLEAVGRKRTCLLYPGGEPCTCITQVPPSHCLS